MSTPFDALYRILPLQNGRQPAGFEFLTHLEEYWNAHKQLVIENWNFYHGYHNVFLQKFPEEEHKDFIDRINNATIENQIKPILNLIISHLYGNRTSVIRYANRNDEQDKEITQLLKKVVWNFNLPGTLDDKKALNTVVSGYTVIQRSFYDIRTNKPFSITASTSEKIKYGYICKSVMDSAQCIPIPSPDDYSFNSPTKFGALLFLGEVSNFIGDMNTMKLLQKELIRKDVIEYIDDKIWIRFEKSKNENKWVQVDVNAGTPYQNRNFYENVAIPYTVYRNTGDPFMIEGMSDIIDMKSLNMELNELATGDKETIRYHQYPILALYGAAFPDDFKRTKNTTLEFPDGTKDKTHAEYITWEGKLEASDKRQESIRRALSTVTGISLLSRGFMKEIGQVRSGPPLKALFTSDRAVMSRKFNVFAACEADDMRADMLFWKAHTKQDFDIDNSVSFHADFADDFLGIDALLEAEVASIRVSSNTQSTEDLLRTEHPDWSEEEVMTELKKIEKQKKDGQPKPKGQTAKSGEKSTASQE